MSATPPLQDRGGALFPLDTIDYLASLERAAKPASFCDCCGDEEPCVYLLAPGCSPICKGCASHHLGVRRAEERAIRSIVGAAITAALHVAGGEVGEELVRRAFEDALHERTRVESRFMQ